MDPNLIVLLAMAGVAAAAGFVAAILQSSTLRQYGVRGALRRRFSGTYRISRF